MEIFGYCKGLKPSQIEALERLYERDGGQRHFVTVDLAQRLAKISQQIKRQVGLLIDRQGSIRSVFVGHAHRIYLPDMKSYNHLRHLHTAFNGCAFSQEDLTDLQKLPLLGVGILSVDRQGQAGAMHYALKVGGTRLPSLAIRHFEVSDVRELPDDLPDLLQLLKQQNEKQLSKHIRHVQKNTAALMLGAYSNQQTAVWRIQEIKELAQTAGVVVADVMTQIRAKPDPHYVVGIGKLEEAVLHCLHLDVDLIIMDGSLTPTQARAIASFSALKVVDRTQLILDIFAQHAKSSDGKLQVELAQLKYTLPRLTDLDAGLSRLTGGIGGRGPGETKLEINRRLARDKITRLERQIAELSAKRWLRRSNRQRSGQPIVAIVGYTNAGKSTLFNRLTASEIWVADQLFATLDPTSRRLNCQGQVNKKKQDIILTDTVGFIHDLPDDLINAFRATLEELADADLLLHVIDATDERHPQKIDSVRQLLKELDLATIPTIMVYNKVDLFKDPFVSQAMCRLDGGVAVSAKSGFGIPQLLEKIIGSLTKENLDR